MSNFYGLKADMPGGKIYDFEMLKGKVVLIVNTASAWYVRLTSSFHVKSKELFILNGSIRHRSGLTPQYSGTYKLPEAPFLGLHCIFLKIRASEVVC